MAIILFVDDEQNQRLLYEQTLQEEDYEVVTADDGAAAVQAVREGGIDLVVLDIAMPGMDGVETMGKIYTENNRLPVILHTAFQSYKDNFMTWAASAYVVKNSNPAELLQTIKDVLSGKYEEPCQDKQPIGVGEAAAD